jgi:hypothetical protein
MNDLVPNLEILLGLLFGLGGVYYVRKITSRRRAWRKHVARHGL